MAVELALSAGEPGPIFGWCVGTTKSTAEKAKFASAAGASAVAAPANGLAAVSDFVVKPVESRRERKAFLELPWQLYRDDPNWIPPLRQNQKELAGFAKHPFYDDAAGQTFLALERRPADRPDPSDRKPSPQSFPSRARGFFGFFESIDNQQVANGLFDAARAWLAARDIHQIRGPVNPSLNYECGLLVDGFHIPATFMMTYNPPFYGRLIENYGFRKAQDLFAFQAPISIIPQLDAKLLFVAQEAAARLGVEMRSLDKSRFRQEIEMFLDLYNQSLGGTWGFVPLSKREIDHMSASLKHLIIPELAMVASVERQTDRCRLRAARLQPSRQGNRRPALSVRVLEIDQQAAVIPPISRDQCQRHSRISALGRRACAPPQSDSKNSRNEVRRRGILLGARVQPPFPPQSGERGSRRSKRSIAFTTIRPAETEFAGVLSAAPPPRHDPSFRPVATMSVTLPG